MKKQHRKNKAKRTIKITRKELLRRQTQRINAIINQQTKSRR